MGQQVAFFKEQSQRDATNSEKPDIRCYSDGLPLLGAKLRTFYPFVTDWQMSEKEEENWPQVHAPAIHSF